MIFKNLITEIGDMLNFTGEITGYIFKGKFKSDALWGQTWQVIVQSFFTTAFAGFFVGAVMSIQFSLQAREFDAISFLGGLATSGTVREVGPLLIAFMLSGKVGAYTSAELGTMRVTEQIDAVRCLGADPISEIVIPRFLGIILSSFFLLAMGLMFSILGGAILAKLYIGLGFEEYIRHIPSIVNLSSILSGLIKCFCFSFLLAVVCTFKGYFTSGGAQGVGRAVISTAVNTMVGLVLLDWLTSFVFFKILLIMDLA